MRKPGPPVKTLWKSELVETLNEYDGWPYIHIRQDESGDKYYCHFIDSVAIFAMVKITEEELLALKANEITILSLFDRQKWLLSFEAECDYIEEVQFLPEGCLPKSDVKLFP